MARVNAVATAIVGKPLSSGAPMESNRSARPLLASPLPLVRKTTPGMAIAISSGGWTIGPNSARRLTQQIASTQPAK